MKHLIIMIASILLGIFLFDIIAGPGEGSVYSGLRGFWENEIRYRTVQDY
ncbi:MAG: hypothetical protein II803_04305 [Firmicutes bacterium]|jgi:hypothetical protein|nr:hypothetical protein [Bacillota bacterium]MBQ4371619.1 hypothetical protein [Bacillota bacterium]